MKHKEKNIDYSPYDLATLTCIQICMGIAQEVANCKDFSGSKDYMLGYRNAARIIAGKIGQRLERFEQK